ncbi:MAG TPA: hypothetical protein VM165_16860 [Planctomycetaceae bacterium]|nr:hypothetical protein [Planctomycetaceae bacterium]
MADETTRVCIECEGTMSPILVMDRDSYGNAGRDPKGLAYRSPDDKRSFWTGKYPSAGLVQSFLCNDCGRIAMYGTVASPATE